MNKKITSWLIAALELGGVTFTLWLWYYAALAINNYARVEGFSLPLLVEWFVWASRYRITVIIGIAFAGLAVMKAVRGSTANYRAVILSLLTLLIFATIIFTVFAVGIGACLCDAWKHWDQTGHPTSGGTERADARSCALTLGGAARRLTANCRAPLELLDG